MVTPDELRDLWEADLREDAAVRYKECPEPWFEIQYTAWMMASEAIPVIEVEPERTWIWSDLHLSDPGVIGAWKRPFRDVRHMDRELLAAWRRHVRDGDTTICLGDLAHPDFWRRNRWNTADLAACPGRRILILGNHDIQDAERLRHVGFTRQHWAALLPTDPMLALTHLPLKRRPVPAWNVHGHIHGAEPPSPRHINVSVERTDYQPLRLAELIRKL